MANGSPLPSYYEYDPDSGLVRFTNSGDQTIDDMLQIVIRSSDNLDHEERLLDFPYPHIQETQPFRVITECGPGSTDIGRPSLPDLEQPANFAQNPLIASGSFTSSNPRCPIETYALSAGNEDFNINSDATGFDVSLQ